MMRDEGLAASDRQPATVYLGLGANVGNRLAALQAALGRMAETECVGLEAVSPVYETEAHVLPGMDRQPDHLNAVARLAVGLAPETLLDVLHRTEREAGRDHAAPRWSPRPLDLDVLLWGDLAFCTPRLTVPHPRLAERAFVLAPLADLAPDLVVPGHRQPVRELAASCADTGRVVRLPLVLTASPPARREPR